MIQKKQQYKYKENIPADHADFRIFLNECSFLFAFIRGKLNEWFLPQRHQYTN